MGERKKFAPWWGETLPKLFSQVLAGGEKIGERKQKSWWTINAKE
jgi:hypothetical protein